MLSESLELGLYPFYFDIGATGERLEKIGIGKKYKLEDGIGKIAQDIVSFHKKVSQKLSSLE